MELLKTMGRCKVWKWVGEWGDWGDWGDWGVVVRGNGKDNGALQCIQIGKTRTLLKQYCLREQLVSLIGLICKP